STGSIITLSAGDITLNKTGTADATTITVTTATTTTRTVAISGITGGGTLGISIAAGTATDTAGNSAAAAGPSSTFTVDNTPPITASVSSPVDGTLFSAGTGPAAPYSGHAADNSGGVGLNANTVTYTLQRDSDGLYWDGANFVSATAVNRTVTSQSGTTGNTDVTWQSNQTLPSWGTQ